MGEIYCVMNMAKRHRGDVIGLQKEANREYENEDFYKGNVDLSRTKYNHYFVKSDDWNASISEVLESENIQEKPDSVVLITSVYAVSPEWLETHTEDEAMSYFEKCFEFEKTKGTVISAVVHKDEDSWHMQTATIPVVDVPDKKAIPVIEKNEDGTNKLDENGKPIQAVYSSGKSKGKVKYKRVVAVDENGNVKTHRGLSAFYVIGNRAKMSRMQTEFYEICGKPFGMSRGKIRVEEKENSRERLTETEYRAKKIVETAQATADAISRQSNLDQIAMRQRERELDCREKSIKTREKSVQARENSLIWHEREIADKGKAASDKAQADYDRRMVEVNKKMSRFVSYQNDWYVKADELVQDLKIKAESDDVINTILDKCVYRWRGNDGKVHELSARDYAKQLLLRKKKDMTDYIQERALPTFPEWEETKEEQFSM